METKSDALKRAKKGGFKKSSVIKSDKGGYFIAPKGVESSGAKKAYADIRASGGSKEKAAKIAWSIEKKKK